MKNPDVKYPPADPAFKTEGDGDGVRGMRMADKMLSMMLNSYENNDMESVRRMLKSMSESRNKTLTIKTNMPLNASVH